MELDVDNDSPTTENRLKHLAYYGTHEKEEENEIKRIIM